MASQKLTSVDDDRHVATGGQGGGDRPPKSCSRPPKSNLGSSGVP